MSDYSSTLQSEGWVQLVFLPMGAIYMKAVTARHSPGRPSLCREGKEPSLSPNVLDGLGTVQSKLERASGSPGKWENILLGPGSRDSDSVGLQWQGLRTYVSSQVPGDAAAAHWRLPFESHFPE